MGKNHIAIFLCLFFIPMFLSGQCLDKKWIRQRIVFLKDSTNIPANVQLHELVTYETAAEYCSYQNDSIRIFLLQRISKLYLDNAEYTNAIYYINKAIGLVTNNKGNPSIDPSSQIKNYYNLASAFGGLKRTAQKIRAYDSCIAIASRLKAANLYVNYCLLEKVKFLYNIGDYNSCVSRADLGALLSHRYAAEQHLNEYADPASYSLDFAIQKVNALVALKKINEAETFLQYTIEDCKLKNASRYLGSLCEQLALIKAQNKNYKDAISYFNQALAYYSGQKDTLSYKIAIHNIGYTIYQENYKDDNKALFYYKKALGFVIHDPERSKLDSINSINIYANIANVFVRNKKYDSAQYYFQCAFDLIKKGTNEEQILTSSPEFIQNQTGEYITGLFIDKGNAFFKEYITTKNPAAINKAIRIYKFTDQLLDRIKTNQIELQSKLFWRKNMHYFYERAIEACREANKSEDAFYFFERSRAILLYDEIEQQTWLGEADIIKQQELSNRINSLQKELLNMQVTSSEYPRVQNELLESKEKKNLLQQQIKERNPLYYQNFLIPDFAGLPEIRKYLSLRRQTMLEIFAGDSSVYSLIITDQGIYLNKIDKTSYYDAVNLCISYLSDPAMSNHKTQFEIFEKKSKHLYDLIFSNVVLPEGRVVISSDGRYFPFEALITAFKNNEPVYFLQNHAVSYVYSARYLMNQFAGHSSLIPGDFLGIAPVKFPKNQNLSALPASDMAVEELRPLFHHPEMLVREKATRQNFLKKFGQYQVIQLYSHSSDSSERGEPVIYFADEPLYLSELTNIETPITRLIVLSACETGSGQFYQGEGVFSFNRSFAALGIPSCVNNLWAVDNESAYNITRIFHRYISEGFPIDIALQKAKLEFIKTSNSRNKLPYYWAATILSGKSDAIPFKSKTAYIVVYTLAAAVAALLLTLVLIMRKKYKRDLVRTPKADQRLSE